MLSEIFECHLNAITHVITHPSRDANAANIRKRLESGGDVDPVSEDIAVLYQNISDINPDTELHLPFLCQHQIGTPQCLLNCHSRMEGMNDRRKFCQHAVTGGPEDLPMCLFNDAIDEGPMRTQGR